jgi:hypothetical protein
MAHRTHRHELQLTELTTRHEPAPRPLPAPPRNPRRRTGVDHAAERHAIRTALHAVERGADWVDDPDAPADR